MVTVLALAVGAIVGGVARLLLPGERDISASVTVLAGLLGIGTVGVTVAELTGIGFAGGSVSIVAGVVGAAVIVLLAERANRRQTAHKESTVKHPRTIAVLTLATLVTGACNGDPATESGDPAHGPDTLADHQWSHDAVGLPAAWNTARGDGVVIAVLDTGVDLDHPDLEPNLVAGWDFIDDDDRPDDPNGHGTHVAGIAAAASDNGIGIAGAAPDAQIMPVRVLDADGTGNDEVIADGIDWAVDHGADIVNLSLGESGFVSRLTKGGAINAAIRRASDADVIVVAAAGNDHDTKRNYRVGVDVIVVNATNELGRLTNFSNTGDTRAVSAPGARITSTAPMSKTTIWPDGTTGWAELDGTSMAAPLVAGAAAILLAAGAPATDVADLLAAAARNPAERDELGAGVIDVAAAVTAIAAGT